MKPLVDLDSLPDYRVIKDDPDPRGWAVVGCDDIVVGTVISLLIDVDQAKARYFVCDFQSRRALVPTAFARLDPKHERILFDTAPSSAFAALPAYDGTLTEADAALIETLVLGEKIDPATPGESVDRRVQPRRE